MTFAVSDPIRLMLAIALVVLANDGTTAKVGAAEKAEVAKVADAVPLPRLNPNRQQTPTITSLIAATEEEDRGVEDSDTAEATASETPAVKPQPKQPATGIAAARSSISSMGLKLALTLLDDGDLNAALGAAYALPDVIDRKIVEWLVVSDGGSSLASERVAAIAKDLSGWPGQVLIRRRFEQALKRENPSPKAVIAAFNGSQPSSDEGTVLLARAYLAVGRKDDAAALIRPYWRKTNMPDDVEAAVRKEFGSLLTRADHKVRMDRLLYAERSVQALRTASLIDKDQRALAEAAVAVIKRNSKATKLLDALPASVNKDPVAIYSRIQLLRRAKKIEAAAALMVAAPRDPRMLNDPDAWWVERKMVSRALIDKRDYKTAYAVAAGHAAESSAERAEAEFHAGWYALEFLRDPSSAAKHFAAIQAVSTMPLSQSRAEYWLGRAAAAAGNKAEATAQFQRAAAYPTTFYGQLALARLGVSKLPLRAPPPADAAARQRFANMELVRVIQRLSEINRGDRNDLFYRHLADTLDNPVDIALLAEMAEASGQHQSALQVGKIAVSRGLPVEALAFPTAAIPAAAKTKPVERPVVYAIARQESAFNPAAVSRAGARGLLQLMPATAKQTAKAAGLPFDKGRLTSDPAYNATLGAAHLDELFAEFNGSYVMTFASYNAGRSRVYDWIKLYGDPRDPRIDVVNWIESIPFTETRNYVQRIMENLQVYRARLGSPALVIEADLRRGAVR